MSKQIVVTTTPHVRDYLEQLVKTGLYGKNAPEAADRLLSRSIEELLKEGSLKRLPIRRRRYLAGRKSGY